MCLLPAALRTFRELRAAGQTRSQVAAGVRTGGLITVRRGVYVSTDACLPAVAAAAHGGALACVSAARHRGLWVLDASDTVHVWLGAHGRAYAHDQCACVAHWGDAERTDAFGLPSVPGILRQILGCRGVEEFFVVLESALNQGAISRADLEWLRTHTNAGAREAIDFARADAQSGLESLLRWRLRAHGLRVRAQVSIVSVGRVDFLIGDRLIVEVDGKENHASEDHRHRDLRRDANAAAWGYITLRFDYAMVVHDWETVELAILACVDREGHLGGARRG
jgi:very-short-patch-repair endonuclease